MTKDAKDRIKQIFPDIRELDYVRVAAAVPVVHVANVLENVEEHIALARQADEQGVDIVCFPELGLTGYSCLELFDQTKIVRDAEEGLRRFCGLTADLRLISIVGLPFSDISGRLLNTAAVVYKGKVIAFIPKSYLPNYGEFQEERYFLAALGVKFNNVDFMGQSVPVGTDIVITCPDLECTFGAEICEDGWMKIPPSTLAAASGAQLLFNLSASNELVGKDGYRRDAVVNPLSGRCIAGYIYVSAGKSESVSNTVFGGHCMISENGSLIAEKPPLGEDGELLINDIDIGKLNFERRRSNTYANESKFWSAIFPYRYVVVRMGNPEQKREMIRFVDSQPFVPRDQSKLISTMRHILKIQVAGLANRLKFVEKMTGKREVGLALSGGRDSILALLVTVLAFDYLGWDRSGIKVITLPGPGTTKETKSIAVNLPALLGTSFLEAEIEPIAAAIVRAAGHEPCWKCLICENAQARVRTNITMALGLMIGTGDMSELFKGWCTFAGDQMSNYNPNCGVPKTLVSFLIQQIAIDEMFGVEVSDELRQSLTLDITPELIKTMGAIVQKTEELIGPYALTDFTMPSVVRNGFPPKKIFWLTMWAFDNAYEPEIVLFWLRDSYRRFFANQFKRQAAPDGMMVGSMSMDPRGFFRMASDVEVPLSYKLEMDEIERILFDESHLNGVH